jgi:hypothetical protein
MKQPWWSMARLWPFEEARLGKEHPETAATYNNIGNVLDADKGDYEAALVEYLQGFGHSREQAWASNILTQQLPTTILGVCFS